MRPVATQRQKLNALAAKFTATYKNEPWFQSAHAPLYKPERTRIYCFVNEPHQKRLAPIEFEGVRVTVDVGTRTLQEA